jgi:hypothetical protein
MTVDGGYGAVDLRTFYLNKGKGSFKVKISYSGTSTGTGTKTPDEIFTAFFNSCTFNVIKRNVKSNVSDMAQEFWDVSLSLEEI